MIVRLLLANGLELLAGVGVVSMLDAPLGSAYLVGFAVVGIVSAHLALVGVSFGWVALVVTAVVSLGLAAFFPAARRSVRGFARFGRPSGWGFAGMGVLAVFFARAWPVFAAKPLTDYDSWAEWGMKGKALTLFGWANPHLFAAKQATPLNLDYPLLLPSLEAIAARAMGGFDSQLIHLQFLLFAVAGLAALHALLQRRAAAWLVWPFLVAIAVAPALSKQLLTAYADVPLALLFAAGVVADATWLRDQSTRTLGLATLFFAAAALTKKEGAIFVVAAYLSLLIAARRRRPLLLSALAVEAALLPWQIWLRVNHVASATSYSWQFVHHPGIAPLIAKALLTSTISLHAWPLLIPLFLACALAAAGTRLSLFAICWTLVSFVGLEGIYLTSSREWSNYFAFTGDRVIDTPVIATAALTPMLATAAIDLGPASHLATWPAKQLSRLHRLTARR